MIMPYLTIASSGNKGRGVFTTEAIAKGKVIEISPVVVLSTKDRKHVEKTKLFNYIFEWGKSHKKAAVALGYISIYNHSYNSNCTYEMDFEEETITIRTVRAIAKGEELSINYNADPNDTTDVWFHHMIKEE